MDARSDRRGWGQLSGSSTARLGVTIASLGLVAAGVMACSQSPEDDGPIKPPGSVDSDASPLFAYLTDVNATQPPAHFVLMRASEVVARAEGIFGTWSQPDNVLWTLDGRYAVAVDNGRKEGAPENAANSVVALDSQSGEVRTIPCPVSCGSIAAVGGSKIMATVDDQQDDPDSGLGLLQMDVGSAGPPVRVDSQLPNSPDSVVFLAGVPGKALARVESTTIDASGEQLYIVGDDGSVGRAAETGENATVSRAAGTARDERGEPQIALYVSEQLAAEGPNDQVVLLNPETAKVTKTDLKAIHDTVGELSQFHSVHMIVNDLWWGRDGHLYATWFVFTDDGNGGEEPAVKVPSTLWRLDGLSWTQIGEDKAQAVRQLNATTEAVLLRTDAEQSYGTLYVDESGQRTQIADKVLAITTPS